MVEGNVRAQRPAAGSCPAGDEQEVLSFRGAHVKVPAGRLAEARDLRAAPRIDEVFRGRERVFLGHLDAPSCQVLGKRVSCDELSCWCFRIARGLFFYQGSSRPSGPEV